MFSTTDPLGTNVRLTQTTWENHICVGHPELEGNVDKVESTIQSPMLIAKSSTRPNDSLVYVARPFKNWDIYLKVAVRLDGNGGGEVSTAHLQKNISSGAQIPGGIVYAKK